MTASPNQKPFSEDELWQRWQANQQGVSEFVALISALRRHARAVVVSVLGYGADDADLVENIVSKALIKAQTQFDGRSRFSTWFHRVALNAAYDHVRLLRRRRERSFDTLRPLDMLALTTDPDKALVTSLLLQRLRKLTTADEYELLTRLSQGQTLKEIARECHLKFRTLQTRWRRLKLRLRQELMATTSGL